MAGEPEAKALEPLPRDGAADVPNEDESAKGAWGRFKSWVTQPPRSLSWLSGLITLGVVALVLALFEPLPIPGAPGHTSDLADTYCVDLGTRAHSVAVFHTFVACALAVVFVILSSAALASNDGDKTDASAGTRRRLWQMGVILAVGLVALYCYRRSDAAGQLSAASAIADVGKDEGDATVADAARYATCARASTEPRTSALPGRRARRWMLLALSLGARRSIR